MNDRGGGDAEGGQLQKRLRWQAARRREPGLLGGGRTAVVVTIVVIVAVFIESPGLSAVALQAATGQVPGGSRQALYSALAARRAILQHFQVQMFQYSNILSWRLGGLGTKKVPSENAP